MQLALHTYQPQAVLRVSGEDAFDYLQSQCSADLASAQPNFATYGLWLSRKGKVEGDGFVLKVSDDDFLITSYHCPGGRLSEKILANAIADEVEIEDLTPQWTGVSLWGDKALATLEAIDVPTPSSSSWTTRGKIHVFEGRRSRKNSIDLVGPLAEITPLVDALRSELDKNEGREMNENEVHLARIEARYPSIPDEIGPNELPQEGFLEKDAVSFEKGCFLGQEVMARLQSMGGVQRKLWVVEVQKKGLSVPSNLFLGDKIVGTLKSCYPNGDKDIGAAILKTKAIQINQLKGIATEPNKKPSVLPLHEFISHDRL